MKRCLHARDVRRGTAAWQHPCRIHKPVLGTRYSGTIPCRTTCTNHDITVYYVQLHIDDAILCIINDVMIVLYWDTDCHLVHENSKG